MDFIDKCKDFSFNGRMLSLDVESLFTKVPVDETLEFVKRKLPDWDLDLPVDNQTFVKLLELCVKDNVFVYDNNFYRQKYGMSMGSPLSPVLCNIFMEYFETELMSNICDLKWLRYVDDLFLVWPEDQDFDIFFHRLNNLHPTIKFKYEWENNNKLSFLDVTVHNNDGMPIFAVFRKPTNSCSYIHFYSSHSQQVKMSVITSMFIRAYRICSPMFLDDEIDTIRKVFSDLKYPRHFIDKAHQKARKKFYSPIDNNPFNIQNKRIISLPHSKNIDHVQNVFKESDIKVVFKYPNTLGKSLINNKPHIKEKAGVYMIPCRDCDKAYFGESGRSWEVRLSEHKRDVNNCNTLNATFNHIINNDHRINWNGAKLLYKANNYYIRRVVESSLISNYPNFNLSQGHFKFNKTLQNCILKATGLTDIT